MNGFFVTLGYGLAALLAVATLVAGWEHWRHRHDSLRRFDEPMPAKAAHVDVDLAQLCAPSGSDDQSARQATMSAALAGMASPPAVAPAAAVWIETRPMVGLGVVAEPDFR